MLRFRMTLLFLLSLATLLPAQNLKGLLNKAKEKITGGELSQEEIGKGLKEALEIGAGEAVDFLNAENGYYESAYKILLPEEARKVTDKLKAVPGFNNVEAELVLRLNRAAELAAAKAKPILVGAITQLTFKDALNILMGEKDAATRYLETTTSDPIYQEFRPVIIEALDAVNARTYWRDAVGAYNKLPLATKVNPELDDYVAKKALGGMYQLIEKKEEKIRTDTNARTSEILKKVFAKQDK